MTETTHEDGEQPALVVRFELDRDTIPADAPISNNVEARIGGRLFVRNTSSRPQELNYVSPAAFELTWTFTRSDAIVFEPTFLPPPMMPPGGRPATTVQLDVGEEAGITNLDGISGFFRQGESIETFAPLPAGDYKVVVSGLRLQEGGALLSSEAAELSAR